MNIEQKFMERVFIMTEGQGCWLWTGNHNAAGRPVMTVDGKKVTAARLSLEFFVDSNSNGRFALHKCHNGNCVRPDHLYWGTKQQNGRDMALAGRVKWDNTAIGLKGEASPGARFRNADVIEMRRLHWEERISYAQIGRQFHVNSGRVHDICKGKRWGHIRDGLPNAKQTAPLEPQFVRLLCIAQLSALLHLLVRGERG